MKLRILVAAMSLIGIIGTAHAATAAQPKALATSDAPGAGKLLTSSTLTTDKDKLSYAIGMDLGDNFKAQAIDINPAILANGIKDAVAGTPALMTAAQREETMMKFQKEFRATSW
jgi:FKBP-type peptidyl-prolyl cis-trans isomerase FklB